MILWILYISSCIAYNHYKIEKLKKRPNYLVANIWRSFFGFVILIITYRETFDPLVNGLEYWPFIVFQLTSFWLLFDPLLNLSRKKPLLYKGKNSGWLDKLPVSVYWVLKACALVVSTIIVLEYI